MFLFSINQFSQFKAAVTRPNGSKMTLHFIHERAPQPHARTILLLHGWPGSFLEFLDVAAILKKTGQYNIVLPSHPGYAFSDDPPMGENFGREDVADLMQSLMKGLGYDTYATQVSLVKSLTQPDYKGMTVLPRFVRQEIGEPRSLASSPSNTPRRSSVHTSTLSLCRRTLPTRSKCCR